MANATGVNTTDVVLFGKQYAGYVWANLSSLSTFGIAGLTNEGPAGGTPWMIVIIAALVAVVIIAVATVLWTRRKRGAPPDGGEEPLAGGKAS